MLYTSGVLLSWHSFHTFFLLQGTHFENEQHFTLQVYFWVTSSVFLDFKPRSSSDMSRSIRHGANHQCPQAKAESQIDAFGKGQKMTNSRYLSDPHQQQKCQQVVRLTCSTSSYLPTRDSSQGAVNEHVWPVYR